MAHQDTRGRGGSDVVSADALMEVYPQIRVEIQALVREEVEKHAAKTDEEIHKALQRLLQKRRATVRFPLPRLTGRRMAAVGVIALLLLGGYSMRSRASTIWPISYFTSAATVPPPAPKTDAEPTPLAASAGTSRFDAEVVRYHSLFEDEREELEPLAAVIAGTSPELHSVVTAWRDGRADSAQTDSMHAALVQAVLQRAGHGNLKIDGAITRTPCGQTCAVVMGHWRGDLSTFHVLPPAPAAGTDPTPEELMNVERALVSLMVPDPQR